MIEKDKMTSSEFLNYNKTGIFVSDKLLKKHKSASDAFAHRSVSEDSAPSESLKTTLDTISKEYVFEIEPVSAPRMSSSDRWKTGKDKRPIVAKYHDFKDSLRFLTKKQNYIVKPVLKIEFYVKMPKSWSNKKRDKMRDMPHQQKPDVDNFLKAFLDCLCKDDKFVWNVHCLKFWSDSGAIIVFE